MKRFASNYLFLPAVGFFRQQVIEIAEDGCVKKIYPLSEEEESIEWMPGVIVLMSSDRTTEIEIPQFIISELAFDYPILTVQSYRYFDDILQEKGDKGILMFPYLLFPFDFTSMRPVAETQHRLLP